MAQLMLHKELLKTFHKLPVKVQKKVSEFVERFQLDPSDPALHLHGLQETMLDSKVRGANLPDGYRAIIIAPERGDTYLMVYIDKHDDAYRWARNKRFEVHQMTGLFQVFDEGDAARASVERDGNTNATTYYPLAKLTEDELYSAGVPKPLLPAVRDLKSDRELDALATYLPPDCRDVLYGISAGMSLDEALHEMLGMEEETVELVASITGPGDFTSLVARPNFDLVLVDGNESFSEVLQKSLEEWRVFLHPYQRKLVDWNTKGPMKITGAAGTGKTVALMHRAIRLAKRLDDRKDKVLVTTYTTNLSITIKSQLESLDSTSADRIEVTNLHALARVICRRAGWSGQIADDTDIGELWEELWRDPNLGEMPMTRDEMRSEYADIVDVNGIDNEDAYLTTVRSARPRISRAQRRLAWPYFRALQRALKKRGLMTFEGVIHEARLAAENGNAVQYRHVLVDEVQDFSLEALRLIRALAPVGEASDPLCVVGDAHQRIYRQAVPLTRAGIETRGRSRRLKINYRTSEQIRRYAQNLLNGLEVDDFDDGPASIVADHSVFRGPEPTILRCKDLSIEADSITTWVRHLLDEGQFATHEICIVPLKASIRNALESAGIGVVELKPREMDPGEQRPGIRMATMKRIKGLEFKAVCMACASPDDPMNHLSNADQRSRCERYVSATRAQRILMVTLADEPSSSP